MKFLLLLLLSATACADTVLTWDASPSFSWGYRVYQGPAKGFYTNMVEVGPLLVYTAKLTPGTYHFAVTAYTALESDFSNDLTVTIATNAVPTLLLTAWLERSATVTGTNWTAVTNFQFQTQSTNPAVFFRVRLATEVK